MNRCIFFLYKDTNIPFHLVNDIIMMSIQKPLFVKHLNLLCANIEIFGKLGLGHYCLIHYVMNDQHKKRLWKLETGNHYEVIYQLNHLISEYNSDKEMDDDFGDTSLGEWFHWHYAVSYTHLTLPTKRIV